MRQSTIKVNEFSKAGVVLLVMTAHSKQASTLWALMLHILEFAKQRIFVLHDF